MDAGGKTILHRARDHPGIGAPDDLIDDGDTLFIRLVMLHQVRRAHGWQVFIAPNRQMRAMPLPVAASDQDKVDAFVVTLCGLTGHDLRPLAGPIRRAMPDLTAAFATFADQLQRKADSMNTVTCGSGDKDDPWVLRTPSQTSDYQAWRDGETLVVQVGSTRLSYRWRAITDADAMLQSHGDWMALGNADEGKPTPGGSLEHWARDDSNPVGGYYGLRKGYRGRFANYVAPLMELMGLVDLEHAARNNRVRARRPA